MKDGPRNRKASQPPLMATSRNQQVQYVNTNLPNLNQQSPGMKFSISGKPASIHGNHSNSITPQRNNMGSITKKGGRQMDELDGAGLGSPNYGNVT